MLKKIIASTSFTPYYHTTEWRAGQFAQAIPEICADLVATVKKKLEDLENYRSLMTETPLGMYKGSGIAIWLQYSDKSEISFRYEHSFGVQTLTISLPIIDLTKKVISGSLRSSVENNLKNNVVKLLKLIAEAEARPNLSVDLCLSHCFEVVDLISLLQIILKKTKNINQCNRLKINLQTSDYTRIELQKVVMGQHNAEITINITLYRHDDREKILKKVNNLNSFLQDLGKALIEAYAFFVSYPLFYFNSIKITNHQDSRSAVIMIRQANHPAFRSVTYLQTKSRIYPVGAEDIRLMISNIQGVLSHQAWQKVPQLFIGKTCASPLGIKSVMWALKAIAQATNESGLYPVIIEHASAGSSLKVDSEFIELRSVLPGGREIKEKKPALRLDMPRVNSGSFISDYHLREIKALADKINQGIAAMRAN